MLTKTIKINSYDVGENSELKLSSLMKYMQQLAVDDIASAGATYESMRADDMVFVIIKFGIEFVSPVRKNDVLEIQTVNNAISGAVFVREFVFRRGGAVVANATTHWVLMSYSRRVPLRPSSLKNGAEPMGLDIKGAGLIKKFEFDLSAAQSAGEYTVYRSSLDENRHLNNTVYADIVLDRCGFSTGSVKECRINFTGEALEKDILDVYTIPRASGAAVCGVNRRTQKHCFEAEIEFA